MAFQIRKAERRRAKLRIGIAGPSGSGKTLSSLLVAYGITGDWEKIGFIDTENGSGELYVGKVVNGLKIGQYLYGRIEAPFTPPKYIEAIKVLEQALGEDGVIIVDSLSHAWAGEGGLLDIQGQEAARSGNSWTAWRRVTPMHNQLVETMLQSKCHIIADMRSKTEYTQIEEGGRKTVKKLGMAPIQRDGMEYEFTLMLDLDEGHIAKASKDRTGLFDGKYFIPSPQTGKELLAWLEEGADAPEPEKRAEPEPNPEDRPINKAEWKKLVDTATANGWTEDAIKAELKAKGFAKASEIKTSDLPDLVQYFSQAREATDGAAD